MDKGGRVCIEFHFGPQDRRRVKGVELNEYVIGYFNSCYGSDNISIAGNSSRYVKIFISGISTDEISDSVRMLQKTIDLSQKSDYFLYDETGSLKEKFYFMASAEKFSFDSGKGNIPDKDEWADEEGNSPVDCNTFVNNESYEDNEDDIDSTDEDDTFDDDNYPVDEDDDINEEDDINDDDDLWTDYDGIEQKKKNIDRIMEDVESLVGAESFKELCRHIVQLADSGQAEYLKDYFQRCALCFSISGGDGLSTYIGLLSRLLNVTGIMKITSNHHTAEIRKNVNMSGMEDSMTKNEFLYDIVSLDLTFMMEKCDSEEFRNFIRTISRSHPDRLPLFKIPYSEGLVKERMLDVLSSAFSLIIVDIPPFSSEEYAEYALKVFEALNFEVHPDAKEELLQLIIQRRGRERFYGFKSIRQLVEDIIFKKNMMEVKEKTDMSLVIREKDLLPMLERYDTDNSGIEELDDLIGIDEIKARIEEILVQLELAKDLPPKEKPCMHMIFTGAPGTGKTTVARILGKILKQKGLLSKGYFFERTGRDLVGRYIGETAPITNAACRDAYGSVLFIDEAYTLVRSLDDGKDFGKEALETLLTQMENHKQDFLVIMAGYSEEMKRMLSSNPGLESRIPHEIKFRNYTREELAQIYMRLARKKYECSDDLEQIVNNYFSSLSDEMLSSENFANARYVRNLYERTVSKAALRYQASTGERLNSRTKLNITADDFVHASNSNEFSQLQKKTQHFIGFV